MPSDKLHHNTGKGKKSESESSLPERKKYPQTKKKENKTKPLNKEKRELLEELDTLNLAELEEKKNIYIKNGFKTEWSEAYKAITKKIEEEAIEEEKKKSIMQRDQYIADGIATLEPKPLDEKPEEEKSNEEKEKQIREIEREEEELIREIAELRAVAEELKKQIDALPDEEEKLTETEVKDIDKNIIEGLDENNYIEATPRLTEFGKERAKGEAKQEVIEKVKKMAQLSFDYLDGKITARQYLQTHPYNYTDSVKDFEEYAKEESEYFRKLRGNKKE